MRLRRRCSMTPAPLYPSFSPPFHWFAHAGLSLSTFSPLHPPPVQHPTPLGFGYLQQFQKDSCVADFNEFVDLAAITGGLQITVRSRHSLRHVKTARLQVMCDETLLPGEVPLPNFTPSLPDRLPCNYRVCILGGPTTLIKNRGGPGWDLFFLDKAPRSFCPPKGAAPQGYF